MEIENINIKFFSFNGFTSYDIDKTIHVKQLPYLSVVQSQTGSYGIKLDSDKEYVTDKGGFFIAPASVTQTITHYADDGKFTARYIFIDVRINNLYSLDDIFSFPTIPEKDVSVKISELFDKIETADCICDKMSLLYSMIKILIESAEQKPLRHNQEIYKIIEFIKENYKENISIAEISSKMKMSESNLYAIFKKATGTSPIRFLNDYRLSAASDLLCTSDLNIGEICEKSGIPDRFYFSKLFKKKYNISPVNYRKKYNIKGVK